MTPANVRTFSRLLLLGCSLALTACGSDDLGEAKLKALSTKAPRDSVLLVMGTGPLTATSTDEMRLVNGFRRQLFLIDAVQYEILWYREAPGSLEQPITRDIETPLVIVDNKLLGRGWDFFEKLAAEKNIPNPRRDAARLDSISKSQMEAGRKKP